MSNNNNFVVWEWCILGFVVAVVPANCKVMSSNPRGVKMMIELKNVKSRNGVFSNVALGCLFIDR